MTIELEAEVTDQSTEYGIIFPDNTVHWSYDGDYNGVDIRTVDGQKRCQEDYKKILERNHIKSNATLKFVRRFKTIQYSKPEPFVEL